LLVFTLKVHFPWNFLVFFVIFFPASIAYSIVRHNLFDAGAIIKRTVGYVVVTAIVVGAYVLVSVYLNVFLGKYQIAQSRAFPIIFTLIIILIFNPLRNRIQSLVDRIFFRKDYDYGEIIDKIGEAITSLLDLDQILKRMMKTFMEDMFIDTSSVMLLNTAKTEYQVYLADGERKREVENLIFRRDEPLLQIIEKEKKELTKYDVVEDPKYKTVSEDCAKNFETLHASLIIPLIFQNEVTGLLTLGEKKSGKFYNREDIDLLHTIAHEGAVAIENARLQQARIDALEQSRKELELLNRAKSKALDHLSHELRTPLALVQGNIRLIKRKAQMQSPPSIREEVFESLEKNLDRLSAIQQETDKIIRSYQEVEGKPSFKTISLFTFAEQILEKVKQQASHRDIHYHLTGEKDLRVAVDPGVLEDILEGLLKNAIENTPDEGTIRILLEKKDQRAILKVQDFGIGITEENQKHIFDGLFHTLDTELYTSKKPFDFGAGGKGLDLLRMKVFGERFGFEFSVESSRCIHIPTDGDLCPGRISQCPHCKTREDCLSSGESTFCLSFAIIDR
jgi:signal transduction histidine kinase